jgi:predicted metal-binding protein
MVGRKADTVVEEEEDTWRGRMKKGKKASCPPGVPRRALQGGASERN